MLRSRLATAVVGVPILLGIIWAGGVLFVVAAALAAAVAGAEAARLLGARDRARVVAAPVGAALIVVSSARGPPLLATVCGVVLFGNVALGLRAPSAGEGRSPPSTWTVSLAAGLYAGLPLALLTLLRDSSGPEVHLSWLSLPLSRGVAWALVTFTVVWAVDTFAFAVGRFGRRRFWPRISPKKTWEGTVAGVAAGTLVGLAWSAPLGLGGALGFSLGLGAASAAILGDLLESGMKRAAGAKDAGSLLPGHGGLLDRLDSLGLAAVVVFFIGVISSSR